MHIATAAVALEKESASNDETSRKLSMLKKGLDEEGFDLRSAIGQMWQKAKAADKTMAANYASVGKSFGAQRDFRLTWLKGEFDKYREIKKKEEAHTIESGEFGTHSKWWAGRLLQCAPKIIFRLELL